jgi:hypothetical protein
MESQTPLKQIAQKEEIFDGITLLCSSRDSYGSDWVVDSATLTLRTLFGI